MPVWVSFRVDDETKEMFEAAANDREIRLSAWLQEVVADAVEAIEARQSREQSPMTPREGT
jgi:hypothetical protein